MGLIDRARILRSMIEQLSTNLEDSSAIEYVELFPTWKTNTSYLVNDRVRYNNILYKVLQDHTSQDDWTPDTAVSLYTRVLIPDANVIPVWEQPSAENAYQTGAKVHYPTENDPVYESLIDNNVWSPDGYPAGWQLVE